MPDQPAGPDVTPAAELEPPAQDVAGPGTFAFFSLEGERFTAPGLPADATREVAAYRAALVDIAVGLWKEEHSDRRRAPNGFADAFDLRLTTVLPGSSRPQLVLNRPARGVSDEDWSEWRDYYERARDVATASVDRVASADAVPADMTSVVRRALSKVGVTLTGEERLRLGAPAGRIRATVTPRVREVLLKIDEALPPEERSIALTGVLTEYNSRTLSFDLHLGSGRLVKCSLDRYDDALAERVREHLAVDGVTAPDVRVEGQTLERDDARVREVYNVHTLEVVWTLPEKVIVHRLRELPGLGPGWLGPGSDAPSPALAALLEPVVPVMASLGTPVAIVANSEGSLVLEWRTGEVQYTAEVAANRTLLMVADNVVTDELREREVPYDAEVLERFMRSGVM